MMPHCTILLFFYLTYMGLNTHMSAASKYRIVGGVPIAHNEYIPHQVSLQHLNKRGVLRHFCGGSIISPKHILTAAHCVEGDPLGITVVAGINELYEDYGQRAKVASAVKHDSYARLVTSDIAILKIEPALKLDGRKVGTIDVSSSKDVPDGVLLTITGWGANDRDKTFPTRLQKLTYKSISNRECKEINSNLTDAEICAQSRVGLESTCSGDSGGPLVMRDGPVLRQVGIAAYASQVCGDGTPNVYTRVSAFADWIKKQMGS